MNISPISDHILLEPIKDEKITASGIIIPDTAAEEHPQRAKVIAIGPGKPNDKGDRVAMTVKPGDTVIFKKYGPDEFKMRDASGKEVEYLIAKEEDILAILQ